MSKFCKTYQVPCACVTCIGVECAHSPKTRGEAEILRGVKLAVDGRVLEEDEPSFAEPRSAGVPGQIQIGELEEEPRRGLIVSSMLVLAAVATAGGLLMAAYFLLEGLQLRTGDKFVALGEDELALVDVPIPGQEPAAEPEPQPEPAAVAVATPAPPRFETMSIEDILASLKSTPIPPSELPPPAPVVEEELPLPQRIERLKERGNEHVARGDFDLARQFYRAALEENPYYYQGFNNLANTYSDEGNLQQAEPIYRQGLEIEPSSAYLRFNLANTHFRAGRFQEAADEFLRVVRSSPGDVEAHLMLGVSLFKVARYEDAAMYFRRMTELRPEHALGHYNLSLTYRRLGQTSMADASYREAVRLDPGLRSPAVRY